MNRIKEKKTPHGQILCLTPCIDCGKYVKRAIVVLEEKLGRYLLPNCYAHHLNGDRGDDRPENLIEVTPSEHTRLHSVEMNRRRLCKTNI